MFKDNILITLKAVSIWHSVEHLFPHESHTTWDPWAALTVPCLDRRGKVTVPFVITTYRLQWKREFNSLDCACMCCHYLHPLTSSTNQILQVMDASCDGQLHSANPSNLNKTCEEEPPPPPEDFFFYLCIFFYLTPPFMFMFMFLCLDVFGFAYFELYAAILFYLFLYVFVHLFLHLFIYFTLTTFLENVFLDFYCLFIDFNGLVMPVLWSPGFILRKTV